LRRDRPASGKRLVALFNLPPDVKVTNDNLLRGKIQGDFNAQKRKGTCRKVLIMKTLTDCSCCYGLCSVLCFIAVRLSFILKKSISTSQ